MFNLLNLGRVCLILDAVRVAAFSQIEVNHMEKITAMLLSIILMFSAATYSELSSDPVVEVPEINATVAVAADTTLHSVPSTLGRTVAVVRADREAEVVRTVSIFGVDWVCIQSGSLEGWLPASKLCEPAPEPEEEPVPQPTEEPIPSWARWGIVNTQQLNVRKGVGVNTERVGFYHYGDRVPVLETSMGWGRTPRGWVFLEYLYFDGALGQNTMDAVVIADRLNIRKGPGTSFDAVGHLNKGDKVFVLEQFPFGGQIWGCTKYGWICMRYVEPVMPEPPEAPSIVGYGVVILDKADVYSPTAPYPVVATLKRGDVVPVLMLVEAENISWALTEKGWILRDSLEIVQTPPAEPEVPTDPTEPSEPTEPEATEPTVPTDPTEPSTDPTEPSTDPTEPSTDPTEPSTDPTEPTTTEPATEPGVPCTSLSLVGSMEKLTFKGQYWRLMVKAEPEDTTDKVVYTSGNESVVTIDEYGRVTAVGEGETTIVVTCGDKRLETPAVVSFQAETTEPTAATAPVAGTPAETTPIVIGGNTGLTDLTIERRGVYITLELEGGIAAEDVRWTTSDSSVATVYNGNVTAIGEGLCVITAEYNGQTTQCVIRCKF